MDCWVGEEITVPDLSDEDVATQTAETSLEDMEPVDLVEVDEDGETPPESWGRDGAGHDDDAEVSSDGGH